MTPLEEKVARAIYSSFGEGSPDDWHEPDGGRRVYAWESALPQARAAIDAVVRAMREPTPTMLKACTNTYSEGGEMGHGDYEHRLETRMWRAMLAEFERSALSPTTPEGRG